MDGYTYSYDRGQNRTSRENLTDTALSELYGYNALDELTSMSRGTISDGTIASPSATESWTLDSLGNFVASTDGGTTQDRTDDAANEIESISGGAATPAYDAAGNIDTTPEPGSEGTGLTCVYDAWDRLYGSHEQHHHLGEYQYDGIGRKIVEFTSFTAPPRDSDVLVPLRPECQSKFELARRRRPDVARSAISIRLLSDGREDAACARTLIPREKSFPLTGSIT